MILNDSQIYEWIDRGLLDPDGRDLVNPASLDFRIGDSLIVEVGGWQRVGGALRSLGRRGRRSWLPKTYRLDISGCTAQRPYWLKPGWFVLAETRSPLRLPNTLGAEIRVKSSRAREGYNHPPTWVDPGWSGILTLEISNSNRSQAIPLYPGLKFGQYVFHQVEEPAQPYSQTGRYHGAVTVEASQG